MEKLIVKNFGPIKEAEIDLTKYVVFIGDTSTGKSVLAKLIAIFRDIDIIYSVDRIKEFKNQLKHYNIDFNLTNSNFEYYFNSISILIHDSNVQVFENNELVIADNKMNEFRKETIIELNDRINKLVDNKENFGAEQLRILDEIVNDFWVLNNRTHTLPIYIPAERIINSLIGSAISGLWANNVALPNCYKEFAAKYEVARKELKNVNYESFDISYSFEESNDFITYEGVRLKLNQASSGIQSLLPLLLVFDYELERTKRLLKTIVIEEPELNLFPIKQKWLTEYIIENIKKKNDRLVITTHSPYILSVLDTLMLAWNTFVENQELKDKISSIIGENKWVDYNDISVYEVKNDGTIQSIKNEEFKSIDTNAIDRVSDIISEEFDKLTELRYAH